MTQSKHITRFLVGGAVRDSLMGREVRDRDWVVVGSTPEQMLAAGFKQVGADFPVFLDQNGEEHALARVERKTGAGYHGFDVEFGTGVTLEDDLGRRDLTVNAMAMTETSEVVDPFGGQADLDARVLRPVSEAFGEDPVRVLRAFRFLARFGDAWTVSPEVDMWAERMLANGEFAALPRERFMLEVEKALNEPSWWLFFNAEPVRRVLLDRFGVRLPLLEPGNPFVVLGEHWNSAELFRRMGASGQLLTRLEVARAVGQLDRDDQPGSALVFGELLSRVTRNANLLDVVAEFDAGVADAMRSVFELRFANFDSPGANPAVVREALEEARFDQAFNRWLNQ
jgi:hypothetical protein